MDKKALTVESYDTHAGALAKKFDAMGPRTGDIEKVFELVPAHPRVFEIGCGNGRDAVEIMKRTPYYHGIDNSREMLKLAMEKVPLGKFELADIETFEFPSGLDLIIAFASLIHVSKESLQKIMARAYIAQNHGGIFRISLKYAHDYKEVATNDEFGYRNYFHYSLNDIVEICGKYLIESMAVPVINEKRWLEVILRK